MIWTKDKILHYNIGYKFGEKYSILGFRLLIVLAFYKELWDGIRQYIFNQKHSMEWNDFEAGIIGSWEGLMRKQNRFKS